jgi:hypothetical protein
MTTISTPRTNRRRDTRQKFVWLAQVKADRELSPSAFMVAFELTQLFNAEYGGAAWKSSLNIAKAVGLSEPSIIRIVRQLRERGHLKIEPGKRGAGHSNRYFMVLKTSTSEGFRTTKKTSIPVKKTSTGGYDLLKNNLQGTLKRPPVRGGERHELTLDVPAGALRLEGGAPEKGKEVVDRFSELLAIWQRPYGEDKAAASVAFIEACCGEPAIADEIIASARRWVAARPPDKLQKLPTWLAQGAWQNQPPTRRRNGKVSWSQRAFEIGQQWGRS